MILAFSIAAMALAAEGPISKFQSRPPVIERRSARSVGDIERCLIDLPGVPLPNVYRQPDRPNKVTIIWIANGQFNGTAIARADLEGEEGGTNVRLWLKDVSAQACL
jgi:hypothetical protein